MCVVASVPGAGGCYKCYALNLLAHIRAKPLEPGGAFLRSNNNVMRAVMLSENICRALSATA